jgi:hypothetical protein
MYVEMRVNLIIDVVYVSEFGCMDDGYDGL